MLRTRGTEPAVDEPVGVASPAQVEERDEALGRSAEAPHELPRRAWFEVLRRTRLEAKHDQVPLMAAGTAFFGLLALVPALVAVVSVYGLVAEPADVQRQVTEFSGALPASARDLLDEQLSSIVSTSPSGLGLALVVSVVVALWSASSGIGHLVDALNLAYDEEETRGAVQLKLQALALTVGAILLVVVAVGLIAVLPSVTDRIGLGDAAATAVTLLRWPLLVVAFMAALSILYRVAPDRTPARWRWTSWGAGIATVLWVLASVGFSVYATNFGSYNETYGSLAGVVVLMFWLYLSAMVVLLG
ncbi:MAG: YihY/virulence factor BrkB family protein, partial [Microthrixaceae bacterium]